MTQDTPFVFNVEAQTTDVQTIVEENLVLTPRLEFERWIMPESGNRYFRVIAPPGKLTVAYSAKVDLSPTLEEPEEIAPASLPLPTFTQLYPSRYCQSDKLERFARSTFGDLKPGYDRVNGICNWIHDYVAY